MSGFACVIMIGHPCTKYMVSSWLLVILELTENPQMTDTGNARVEHPTIPEKVGKKVIHASSRWRGASSRTVALEGVPSQIIEEKESSTRLIM